ncbi:MAG: hypothetical protein C4519_19055 [Desulfobacteraceae bacterium]|nr:MAG: hypothetical protein C4519_19055 [Desulfobacteraceae bacterium]
MQRNKEMVKGFVFGAMAVLLLTLATGAIYKQTSNVTDETTISFQSIYASSDGNIVYVCDNTTVYRSTDGGANWTVVFAKRDNGNGY